MNTASTQKNLQIFLSLHDEILLVGSAGSAFSCRSNEISTEIDRERILISFVDRKGFQTWRIASFEFDEPGIKLHLSRNFGKESEILRIVPRILPADLEAAVEIARLEQANKIAELITSKIPGVRVVKIQLNKDNGRFAEIFMERAKSPVAVFADVSQTAPPELHISNAILKLRRLERRKKAPINDIWIAAETKTARKIQKLHALLTQKLKYRISIFEIIDEKDESELKPMRSLELIDLWRQKAGKLTLSEKSPVSASARQMITYSPESIDCITTKSGETLRFNGIRFSRIRRVFDREKCWFGIEREKQILSEKTFDAFENMIGDLEKYRAFDSPNKRHEFYRQSPEAWLESIFRRNIKLLDDNLILSPIYNQFRTANDKIDLLALRRDGRLVIIELKTSQDREMIFQAADYWRKIELQRRKGVLNSAKIFGDLEIADRPTIVYLVAPTLGFHPDFQFLAECISEEINIYRFDLAENWREEIKVLRREKI